MSEATLTEATQAVEPATQAQPVTEPANLDNLDEALALLNEVEGKAATQNEARTEPETPSTEPEADDEQLAAVKAAREAAAEEARTQTREELAKETDENNKRADYQRQVDGITASFRQRAPSIRNVLGTVLGNGTYVIGDNEYTGPQLVNWVLNEFTSQHGQSAMVANKEYWDSTLAYAQSALPEDAAKSLIEGANKGQYRTHKDLLDAIVGAKVKDARSGHFTEAQVKEREALATLAALKKFQADPDRYLSRTRTAASRGAGVVARYSSEASLSRAFNNNEIDRATYGREYKRLTGREP